MQLLTSVAEARATDARVAGEVGEAALIARAAAAVAARAMRMMGGGYGRRVLVLAGSGHNGADALRAGALLARRGAWVRAVATAAGPGDGHVQAAWAALAAAGGRLLVVPAWWPGNPPDAPPHALPHTLRHTGQPGASPDAPGQTGQAPAPRRLLADVLAGGRVDLVLDGMVGRGGRGALRGEAAAWASALRETDCQVLAVDVPSGVDADTGRVAGPAVAARVTVAFGAPSIGLAVGAGGALAGEVVVAEIGLAPEPDGAVGWVRDEDLRAVLADPPVDADKYRHGVVGVLAGGSDYPGAAVLCVGGAVRAGAGYVRAVALPGVLAAVQARFPTVVGAASLADAGRVDAWVAGPGLAADRAADVRAVLASRVPVVLDAGALEVVAEHPELLAGRAEPVLLTPHAGEFARLAGLERAEVEADPLGAARALAARLGVVILLKGPRPVLAHPDGRVRVVGQGTSWLATAGAGDVLAGAAGALCAWLAKSGVPATDLALLAGSAAAAVHQRAGVLASAGGPIAADALLGSWAPAVRVIRGVR